MGAKGLEQKLKVHGWRFKARIFMALPDKGLDDDYKLFAQVLPWACKSYTGSEVISQYLCSADSGIW